MLGSKYLVPINKGIHSNEYFSSKYGLVIQWDLKNSPWIIGTDLCFIVVIITHWLFYKYG